ncbi:MAG: RlmE family RNA methyltransferase [Candidatus Bathyarchaeia archaeon]
MSGSWRQERGSDYYYRQAKRSGYRSRSAYKLKQLNNRFHFLEDALTVLDLGAYPGGWLQVASEEIPPEGLVVGFDLEEIEPLNASNVETVVGDVREEDIIDRIYGLFAGKVDVILSDMAPNVSGVWELDQYRQIYLARIALVIADRILRRDGWFIVKTFQGSEHSKYFNEVKDMFRTVHRVKPKASRKESAEIYIVAHRLKGNRRLPEEFRDDEG